MQTILGANGVIATELSKHLPQYTKSIRQVSRHPKKVNEADETVEADLLDYNQAEKAVAGSEIVYLLAGLKYDIKTWKEQWPKLMRNVIDACKKHNSKLVFFDNVYAYGLVTGTMTEETPFRPNSKKGEVRAQVATMLLDEITAGNVKGMIVRAADFYGPGAIYSLTYSTVTQRLKAGKGPQWIGNPKAMHTFTYTPDAGKSVAMLGNTASAYNQTWHALTSKEKMSGEDYVRIACEITGRPYSMQSLRKFGVSMVGIFSPILHEFVEMMYQFENDYVFDSTKFEKAFNTNATAYRDGIAETLK
jgi:nucleoside-diphosphate-sugar epimerase